MSTLPESTPPEEQPAPRRHERMRIALMARLRAYFLAGILITAPVSITIYLAWLFVSFVDTRVSQLLPAQFSPETYLPFGVPGVGLITIAVALTAIGALTAGYVGRLITRILDGVLERMPVLRSVYRAVKQVFETVLASKSDALRQAVLVEYPRRGMWTIGFLTGVTRGEVQTVTGQEVINVFIPTTPNPTSGYLLFVPRADVIELAMSVEDALKMIVSGGIVSPQSPEEPPAVECGPEETAEPRPQPAPGPA